MINSIRWRIAIPFVLLIVLIMAGVGIYLSNFVRQSYLNDLKAQLTAEARLTADYLAPSMSGEDPDTLDALARHWADMLGARVTIISADGTVIGESHENRRQMDNHLGRPEIMQALAQGQGSSTRFSQTAGYDMLYAAVPVTKDNQVIGFMRVAIPLQQVQANVANLQRTLIATTLVATLIAILLATWIASRTTRPLRELTEAVEHLSSGDLHGRILPVTPDEVGQLTLAFNNMAVQLSSQIEDLEAERSKIAAVLAEMTDGVLIVDAHGLVQLLNPAAEGMFEIAGKDALGRSVAEVLRHHQLVELWQSCHDSGSSQAATIEIGARRLYLQGMATPFGNALPGSTLLLFQNLTHLRRLETVRRDFISNISHELRTPLASLKALTETLQAGALEDPPAARRFLQRMETEVDALSLMVSELLELSRIESGRVPLQFKPVAPVDLVSQAIERLHLQSERAGLSVAIDCPGDLPLVLADQNRLEQVIVNLLHNAIKFTPSGGQIIVQAAEKNEPGQEKNILFSVSDNGIGISSNDLPRIFERFFKSDRARSTGGTGLGLAIAKHMVEAHGGKIWAESIEGKGSTFYFYIPQAL
jgi:two-component system, OmpR family, phosphate regulon sensor histidine kinase PhoR